MPFPDMTFPTNHNLLRDGKAQGARAEFDAIRVLESITDAFFALDTNWNFMYLNAQAERLLGQGRVYLLGKNIWEEFPAAIGTAYDEQYHQAVAKQITVTFKEYYPSPIDLLFEVRGYPSELGLSVYFRDITEESGRVRRERFLSELAERARALTDPNDVIHDAVSSICTFLDAARCVFADIDIVTDECTIPRDYCADETISSMVGTFPISAFGEFLVREYAAGRMVAVPDVHEDSIKFPPENVISYDAINCRAFIAVPVIHTSRLVSVVAVHSKTPREWTPDEIALVQAITERTWLTVEVLRQHVERARELEEQRARASRDALLSSVGLALRTSSSPEAVQATAVNLLAETLNADRCYFGHFDLKRGSAVILHDWHRADLASITGAYALTDADQMFAELYGDSEMSVIFDTHTSDLSANWKSFFDRLGLTSQMSVAFAHEEILVASLTVAMAGEGRVWTSDEVALIKAAATQMQTAIEVVRIQEREHKIAQILQDALQPELPQSVPNMRVGTFTKAAWEEAQIGGDFFDIFSLDNENYACVIGDVSGKGLAAAQQLALIRNGLRTTLYLYRSPAQAVVALNHIVTSHGLLAGFVTLWVGVYDSGTGHINYVSCGHEPGLIRRLDSSIELTKTTGPPLGVMPNAEYEELTVTLVSGDRLLLYTDGLSESGPSSREMLGTDGLMNLMTSLDETGDAQSEAESLVASASEFSHGVFRDDVAVLLMRRN